MRYWLSATKQSVVLLPHKTTRARSFLELGITDDYDVTASPPLVQFPYDPSSRIFEPFCTLSNLFYLSFLAIPFYHLFESTPQCSEWSPLLPSAQVSSHGVRSNKPYLALRTLDYCLITNATQHNPHRKRDVHQFLSQPIHAVLVLRPTNLLQPISLFSTLNQTYH